MQELSFEWDDTKAEKNLVKHGVTFEKAAAIFADPTLEGMNENTKDGEVRYVAYGLSGITVLRVTYTWRSDTTIRIISARKANKHDQEKYYREIYTQ